MTQQKPIDVQCGPDVDFGGPQRNVGCRLCNTQADVAYVLCSKHQRLARAAPDLLAALKETVECWGWNPDVKPAFWDNFELVPSELAYRKRVSAAIAKAEEGS